MKKSYLLRILHAIEYRHSIDDLIDIGLSYSQIAKMITEATKEDLIILDEDKSLRLTEHGKSTLAKLTKELFPAQKIPWLLPTDAARIEPIDKFDIYLPKKNRKAE